jgi:microcystin degradation protein MlrC
MTAMRIVTGGISHETTTFAPIPTTWLSYDERFNLRGEAILEAFRGTNTPIGGFMEGAAAHGFELVPTLFAEAFPSAPTPRRIFDRLVGELVDRVAEALPADALLLDLHGAMVVEGIDDAESGILGALRDLVGPAIPIVAQLDIHSHMSHRMIELADVLIGRETYPEVDMAERARECADVLMRILRDGLRPVSALHRVPMAWCGNDVTAVPPASEAIAELHRIERQPGVVCGSIAIGYPFADVPDMGVSAWVVTDGDRDLAQSCADNLGRWIYDRRETWWDFPMPSTREALALARREGAFPVVFADTNDNTGGGTGGDSTGMLQAFLEADLEDACLLYIVDAEAIARCREAGVGATVRLEVGAKSSPLQGRPVRMTAEVTALGDGRFRYEGPMYRGLEGNLGPSACIRQGGVHVVLVSKREQPFDPALARTLGLEPRRMRFIGLKSSGHFRASFGTWAGAIHVVYEPSVHDFTLRTMPFHRLGRPLYPINGRWE